MLYPFWGSLTEALKTGEPKIKHPAGSDLFDELYKIRIAAAVPQIDDRP